jgi:hypothetical protein
MSAAGDGACWHWQVSKGQVASAHHLTKQPQDPGRRTTDPTDLLLLPSPPTLQAALASRSAGFDSFVSNMGARQPAPARA